MGEKTCVICEGIFVAYGNKKTCSEECSKENHHRQVCVRRRLYRKRHRDELNAYNRKWRKNNPDKHRLHRNRWKEKNPEKWALMAKRGSDRYRKRQKLKAIDQFVNELVPNHS